MIVGFKSKRLERFFFSGYVKALRFANKDRVVDVLERLERAESLRHFARPRDRLHKLKGEFDGFYSVRISKNYRIIFRWVDGEGAHDVDLLDYH